MKFIHETRCRLMTLLGLILTAVTLSANAYDWQVMNAKVVSIEVSYMPDRVLFYIDQPAGSCGVGGPIKWVGRGVDQTTKQGNAKAVLATLIAAKTSGTGIQVYGLNSNCEAMFLYLG